VDSIGYFRRDGVNLVAPATDGFGLNEATLSLEATLAASGTDYKRFTLESDDLSALPYKTTIVRANPWILLEPSVRPQLRELIKRRSHNIGYWVWESLNTFYPHWLSSISIFRELWTPSAYSNACLARVSPVPVYTLPHAIRARPAAATTAERSSKQTFNLITFFDPLSLAQRKNPQGSLKAFSLVREELRAQTMLTIKTRGLGPQDRDELQSLLPDMANVNWINRELTRDEVTTLLSQSDALISLHRAEGFGLTLAEAMALGKPVIATNYSGNLEFMNSKNSILVPWRPVCVSMAHPGQFPKGTQWAEADPSYAASSIESLILNRELAQSIGATASDSISQQLSPAALAPTLRQLLSH
jgi:glycosyltransferase involved in cell wall biosynthesis